MYHGFLRFIFIFVVGLSASISVSAQTAAEREEVPKGIMETLARNRIEREKKDFNELLERGEEAAKLGGEIDKSFAQNKSLTLEDQRKLERLEKISKKIRQELGGDSDEDSDGKSAGSDDLKLSSTPDAIDKLKSISARLAEELKKTSRYTISTVAVQSSNAVLKIVRFIRAGKK